MGTVAFDTLKAAKQLGEAGFEPKQAEALVSTFAGELNDTLATKEDIEQVEERLNTKIDTSVAALNTKIDTSVAALQKDVKALDAKIDAVEERLDAKIDAVEERLSTKIDTSVAALDTKIDQLRESLEVKIEKQGAELGEQIANIHTEVANGYTKFVSVQVAQLRWMIGSIIALSAVLVAAITLQ